MDYSSVKHKRGVGIVEALVASAVLGLLLVALLNFQSGNRESLLRIRGRDGAVAVAHNVMDSLNAVGLTAIEMPVDGEGNSVPLVINRQMEWVGTPGLMEHTMRVEYTVSVSITDDGYVSTETSDLRNETHVYAKRLNVLVEWPFKNSTQSITLTGVIR